MKQTWLMLPMQALIGFQIAFNYGAFPRLLTAKRLNLVMATFAMSAMIASLTVGYTLDCRCFVNRQPLMQHKLVLFFVGVATLFASLGAIVAIDRGEAMAFIAAGLLGFTDGGTNVVYFTATGVTFGAATMPTAFAVFQFVQSATAAIMFALGA
jgi:hypothetical protein